MHYGNRKCSSSVSMITSVNKKYDRANIQVKD